MLAATKTRPAPGIELLDVEEPAAQPGEVLVEVAFCGVCGSDLPVYRWDRPPAEWTDRLPRIMGHEFSGYVVDGGDDRIPTGALVAVEPGVGCGRCEHCRDGLINLCRQRNILGQDRDGAFARYVRVPAQSLWPMPDELDPRRAAFLEVFALALHAVERARLGPADSVLIVGAGPVAIAIASLCARPGASQPVLVGTSADAPVRLPIARAVGAEALVADSVPDAPAFTKVFEASGAEAGVVKAVATCITGGKIVAIGTPPRAIVFPWEQLVMRAIRVTPIRARLPRHWAQGGELLRRLPLPDDFFAEFPLSAIDQAFDAAIRQRACKVLVTPN
jgi:threonine dehydrogenase-like Zn-dependent dehydrogenase